MIRALIEVAAETQWDFDRDLREALGKLGFEPKRDEEHGRFMAHLHAALNERGIEAWKLVEEYRERVGGAA